MSTLSTKFSVIKGYAIQKENILGTGIVMNSFSREKQPADDFAAILQKVNDEEQTQKSNKKKK